MKALIIGCLVLALSGCTSWQVVDVSPRALVDSAHVTKMQVWEKSGVTVLFSPAVSGDSLTGRVTRSVPAKSADGATTLRSIALTAVDRVAVRKVDGGLTMGALLAGAAAVALGAVIFSETYTIY